MHAFSIIYNRKRQTVGSDHSLRAGYFHLYVKKNMEM